MMATYGDRAQVEAIAMLLRDGQFVGTCFPFRWRHIFLTARHCVKDTAAESFSVRSLGGKTLRILEVKTHPSADIAALIGDKTEQGIKYPFTGLAVGVEIGDPFVTFGFPTGSTYVEREGQPAPRIFRGYTQRTFDFPWGGGKPYRAYELNIPSPEGLSGGPVFVPGTDRAFAMVTDNLESYTTPISEEVRVSASETHLVEGRQIVAYGVALSLRNVEEWLKDVAPLSGDAVW